MLDDLEKDGIDFARLKEKPTIGLRHASAR
jgi:hypothetical protein